MMTDRVPRASPKEVDAGVVGWLREALDAAG
jgi:hypothetical protein